jgi:hypothetical protein
MWTGSLDASHFEVGLVQIRNGDHRNGVVRALGVSPFNVKFVSSKTRSSNTCTRTSTTSRRNRCCSSISRRSNLKRQRIGAKEKTFLTAEEAYASVATDQADMADQNEEWIDLTDSEEYERNIRRNEAELTTRNSSASS